ncbi:cytidine deaminase [Ammonifex degensii KC4]|uniref:Cytidine deaminase n=1 Tax=Ammonifex degensii (strain DSM 10501 / KC4) TaxID=429009 RepID=C9RAN3_AMMDK|nr:cytidine deaminase [Ammonifex degensii]ACX51310.1 cytidine deaminase [Ammonifex degensii KC4]
MRDEDLVRLALEAKERAYAPYSGIKVGAALLTREGKVFTGANVENASYGLTLCAERVAAVKAVSEGMKEWLVLAVAWNREDFCRPCGACRQVLFEFAPALRVLMANARGEYEEEVLAALLPSAFAK